MSDQADILARALTEAVGGALGCDHIAAGNPRGAAAVAVLTADFQADWGATATATGSDLAGGTVTATAPDPTTRWRYASWLVANAQRCGVERVELDGLSWAASAGRWKATTRAPAGAHGINARVFPAPGN